VGVAQYNAVYGSFAALPLFLVWLQLSWLIVLFGAELSFACQHAESYEFELDLNKYSRSLKNLISLAITHLIIKNFITGTRAQSSLDISNHLELLPETEEITKISGMLKEFRSALEKSPGNNLIRDI
jgi:membrane protein